MLAFCFVFSGCTKETGTEVVKKEPEKVETDTSENEPAEPAAQKVVEDYFIYIHAKNQEKADSLFYQKSKHDYGFSTLEEIKLLSIKENKSKNIRKSFVTRGMGQVYGTRIENVRIYEAEYEVKYTANHHGPLDSGEHWIMFSVVRDNEGSPWLIGDLGQ